MRFKKYTTKIVACLAAGAVITLGGLTWLGQVGAAACPCSLWSTSDIPAIPAAGDAAALELGVKFKAETSGSITGVRFYKGSGNGGTHIGSLWTTTGTRLATATFTNETATGWQTVTFPDPVPIHANTTYVASYFAPQGRYSVNYNYFTAARNNAPLQAPASTASEPNGVFRYGPTSGFPTSTHLSSNYWVDVVFTPGPPPPPEPAQPPLDEGFGGPVLVVKSDSRPFSKYYTEILRGEGINSFDSKELGDVTAVTLSQYDVVILGEMPLTDTQVTMLSDWVNGGGNLIAMRPDKKLKGLMGLTDQSATLAEGYMLINTAAAPGAGLPGQTMQYHGAADRYTLASGAGTTMVARLYSNATASTNNPAVTMRNVGSNGGQAVAFTYDLARSIVYTRQGNPAWVGDERDGDDPLRPVDLFYGARTGDVKPDWVNLSKVAIPQADEQQRLLSNIVNHVNQDNEPVPKMWYLPKGHKAAVVLALDDHDTANGTRDTFEQLKANSPAGCSVAQWECVRGTSWFWLGGTTLTNAQASAYHNQGFDLGIHVDTGCADWTPTSLNNTFDAELQAFANRYPSLPPQTGNRTHCIVWSDWATQPKVEYNKGIRMDLNYYYAPASWVQNRPGLFTGSGLPMRFADLDGSMIDVYQVGSHLVDENGQSYPAGINALLDRAIGPEGYYGVFGSHFDLRNDFYLQIVAAAKARGIPLVSAKQMLDWTDGRNNSRFTQLAWNGNSLTFAATADSRTNGMLRGMLPMHSAKGTLTNITRDGTNVSFTQQTIKGVTYAMFPVASGNYSVGYEQSTCPCSMWTSSTTPGTITANDATAGELGFKFTPAASGRITAVKFYKGPQNTGTHTVSVWSLNGTRLATATATNETASGWQTVQLPSAVNVTAGTTYIASYFAPVGRYSYDYDYFANPRTRGPLTAPSSVGSAGNGVFNFGSNFPDKTFRDLNYWVDVVFRPTAQP